MYPATGVDIATPTERTSEGSGMLIYIPHGIFTGRLSSMTAVEELGPASTPDSYVLGDAYPNPFNPETTIEFSVPFASQVRIEVFNTAGQLVATLVDEELGAGSYKSVWNGLDKGAGKVSSGVYFYRMEAGGFTATRSMTLLK